MRQSDGTHHAIAIRAVLRQVLSRVQRGVAVRLEKVKEVVAANKIQLAGLHGFNCQFVGASGDNSMQAQDFARLGEPHN
jgi:hypothetical protein